MITKEVLLGFLWINYLVIPATRPQRGNGGREPMPQNYYVYILASQRNGTLYIGVTSNLPKRIWEHKNNVVKGFTQEHHVHQLVYYEQHDDPEHAILRETRIKKWGRSWKIRLIEKNNPGWKDLYDELDIL